MQVTETQVWPILVRVRQIDKRVTYSTTCRIASISRGIGCHRDVLGTDNVQHCGPNVVDGNAAILTVATRSHGPASWCGSIISRRRVDFQYAIMISIYAYRNRR
eukprot:g49822.t1